MSELTDSLCQGKHPVSMPHYQNESQVEFALREGLVLLTCDHHDNAVELALPLDQATMSKYALHNITGEGKIAMSGQFSLDFKLLNYFIELDTTTFAGEVAFTTGSMNP